MGKKRVYKSVLGIPIWFFTGISIFIIFSVVYDLVVGDRNVMRYGVLGGSIIILIISIIIHLVKIETISRMARRQMGGN